MPPTHTAKGGLQPLRRIYSDVRTCLMDPTIVAPLSALAEAHDC
jgi:hypothetical protein